MFGNSDKIKINQLLQHLEKLENATRGKSPKRVNTSLAYIVERCAGFSGESLADLSAHMTKPPPRKPRTKKPTTQTKVDVNGLLQYLEAAAADPYNFKAVVDQFNKDHNALTMKELAAQYAKAPKPKTKADAVRLLVAARNDRARAKNKANEASRSTPW